MATTASLTNTPTQIDAGTSASVSISNTGSTFVTIVNAGQLDKLRPGRSYDRPVYGVVTARIDPPDGTTGSVSYEVQGTRNTGIVGIASRSPVSVPRIHAAI